ncbi:GDSL family lipase [Nocardia sp. SYP-A9097]|uniref:DUF459 domain-containing protein n=1 Tax=Nocardia sp. SYP-A9097 TaxID=2663237 RepID=UPI00129B587E|nr:GDSL-type esterase/lipase family protein [Nocardia sp. SYP-A9097]MRH91485.1 GDSL family lipase [Nocardia sp. SYP-A9097]
MLKKIAYKYMLMPSIRMRISQFERLPTPAGGVVFLGDSLTEGGLWHEWFPEVGTVNRGINGDTIGNLRARLDSAIVDPTAVFVLIGTNDLGMGATADEIGAEMRLLVRAIRDRAPGVPLYLQSVPPRQPKFADRVRALNRAYRTIAEESDAVYIDLWPALADENGGLRAEFTGDGLHLGGAGYSAWAEVLRPHLRRR